MKHLNYHLNPVFSHKLFRYFHSLSISHYCIQLFHSLYYSFIRENPKLTMFKAPFSFQGRIRRTEYAISVIIYTVVIILIQVMLVAAMAGQASPGITLFLMIIMIPLIYFMLAQGAKRCHDRGNSGWFQLIPFYGLWMMFADSDHGANEYGPNPKGVGNVEFSFEEGG